MQGRGLYVSDIELPRMVHVVFLRSPYAHARIMSIDASAAKHMPGVIAVVTGQELAAVITPWVGVLSHLKGLKSAPQSAIAIDRVCWQGEAVAAVVANSRAAAEDAAEHIVVEYEELDAVTDMSTALDPATLVIHASLGDNLAFERNHDAGAVDQAFAGSDEVVEAEFVFGQAYRRDTRTSFGGGRLECRGSAADHLSRHPGPAHGAEYRGTSSRAPRGAGSCGMQGCRRLLRHQGAYLCRRDGNLCAVETAAAAGQIPSPTGSRASIPTSMPVTTGARGKIGVQRDGTITAFEIEDLTGIGPYSMYPRTSAIEANQVVNLVGGPYVTKNYRARARVVFQNKNVMCQYRAVGHPIACSVTEGLVDLAAMKIGMDPVEIRRRNLIADDAYPCASPSGLRFEKLSHHAALAKLISMMDYDTLRSEQAALRSRNIHRGIGIASFIEVTNPSAAFYGVGGAKISAQDGVAVRLDAQGSVICQTSITEQGPGIGIAYRADCRQRARRLDGPCSCHSGRYR